MRLILAAVLPLLATTLTGSAAAAPPSVSPASVERALEPGASTTVDKTVTTPQVGPRPDVVLLVDGTASMSAPITNVKQQLPLITDSVRAAEPDSRFAVATYGDVTDGSRAFEVLQPFTTDQAAVQHGVDQLTTDRGLQSGGPAEDWINALFQVAQGAGGATAFRDGASPVVVLVGDASSHDPSLDHTLRDAVDALVAHQVRVLAVDVDDGPTRIGDGLDGNGDGKPVHYACGARNQPACDPLHEPGEATTVTQATGGTLLAGVDSAQIAGAIATGLTELPTTVTHRVVGCDSHLAVSLDPPSVTVTSGDDAHFTETITAAEDARRGTTLHCAVQFALGSGGGEVGTAADDPNLLETISITVGGTPAPAVTPAAVVRNMDPGASTTVAKSVTTPVVPARPDVVLLVDGTGSMSAAIANVVADLGTITSRVRQAEPGARFAAATYGDEADGERAFEVLQPLTDDADAVHDALATLKADRGLTSGGPAEDWINALVQVGGGAAGAFREQASPIVVLVGDASSHDPSLGHPLSEAESALTGIGARLVAVDVADGEVRIGDGLDGDGDPAKVHYACGARNQPVCDDPHLPGQASEVVRVTGGKLFSGIDPTQVADTIATGLSDLPTTVSHQPVDCDPNLQVTVEPDVATVPSGDTAAFTERITVAPGAPQGATLRCTEQFATGATEEGDDPNLRETIAVTVDDVTAPVVTVDDRVAQATGPAGAQILYTATASDNVDGPLTPTCTPASGSTFPVGLTTVTCTATDRAGLTGTDTATFQVLSAPTPPSANLGVTAVAAPNPTFVGGRTVVTFTITNAGPQTATGVVLTSAVPVPADPALRSLGAQSDCTTTRPCSLAPGARRVLTLPVGYQAALTGTVRGTVTSVLPDPVTRNNTAVFGLSVLQPVLTVSPTVGPPGLVAQAHGTRFPPGATIDLVWDPGLTATRVPIVVERDGTFQTGMLILRKDQLGQRVLRASGAGFSPVQVPFLVVPRDLQPPEFAGRG